MHVNAMSKSCQFFLGVCQVYIYIYMHAAIVSLVVEILAVRMNSSPILNMMVDRHLAGLARFGPCFFKDWSLSKFAPTSGIVVKCCIPMNPGLAVDES